MKEHWTEPYLLVKVGIHAVASLEQEPTETSRLQCAAASSHQGSFFDLLYRQQQLLLLSSAGEQ